MIQLNNNIKMAKKPKLLVKLVSTVGTGCFYTYKKSKS